MKIEIIEIETFNKCLETYSLNFVRFYFYGFKSIVFPFFSFGIDFKNNKIKNYLL